ncbi:acyl-homoserine-lactone synthase [Chelativorans xinjiangense]|uniref:acyl-homoserine-lactone synthase n=1 Tax=Chelativorans xinjiangense TaxID=2681485 RepID=UPI0013579BC6|nr:acyl-homoserine-lactone synthase [Chelativorans xinjiangense]
MFTAIQAPEYSKYNTVLDEMFRLRKKTFYAQLKWNVSVQGDYERDRYDELNPVYLIWCNQDATVLYASTRLMPTTGPTLLYDTFRDTFPDAANLSAPGIWEGTRLCVHNENLARDHPDVSPLRAIGLLSVALAECAYAHGIDTIVTNYEPYLKRIYASAGLAVEEIGRADGYGRYPVCCGVFEVSETVIAQMRAKLGLTGPVFGRHDQTSDQRAA